MTKIKFYLISAIVLFIATSTFSQAFQKDDNIISLGYGFPNTSNYISNNDLYTNFKSVSWGPIHAKIEHAVNDNFGIGLSINSAGNTTSYMKDIYSYKFTRSSIKFNIRFNYHFGHSETFDPYIGFGIGYGAAKNSYTSNEPGYSDSYKNPLPIGLEGTIGCRYFVSDNIAIYAEAGIAKSIIQVGISSKF